MRLTGTNRGRATARGQTWEAEWEWEETWTLLDEAEADSPQEQPEPPAAPGEVLREGRDFRKQAELERRRETLTSAHDPRTRQEKGRVSPSSPHFPAGEGETEAPPGGPLSLAREGKEEAPPPAAAAADRRAERAATAPLLPSSAENGQPEPSVRPGGYRGNRPAPSSRTTSLQLAAERAEPDGWKQRPAGAQREDDEEDRLPPRPRPRREVGRDRPAPPGTTAGLADTRQAEREERRRRVEWAR